jgi:uncharacterized protein YceH (UPF0502 family)
LTLDQKTIALAEKKVTEAVHLLRKEAQKRFDKYMKLADKTDNAKKKARHFTHAIRVMKMSQQLIEELETKMASIKNPWRADEEVKKSKKSKKNK